MNIDTAKTISIIDLLRTLDHAPVSIRGDRYNYLSPIRTEKEPSFCVSKKRNEWYDFGLGQGGDIINLSKRLFETNDVSEVLNRLDKLNISHVEHSCKTIKAASVQTAVKYSISVLVKEIWESLKNDSFLRKKQIFSVENYCLRDFLRRFLYKHTTVSKICSNFVQN